MLDGSVSFRRVVQLRTIRKLGCSASSCRETTVPLSCLNARPEGSTQGNVADKPSSGFVNTTPLIRTNPGNAANFCVARDLSAIVQHWAISSQRVALPGFPVQSQ